MMEKNLNFQYPEFQKKITSYLDGSLNPEERNEFEAFVATHPDFEQHVKKKESELAVIKGLVPSVKPTEDQLLALESEMKESIHHLLGEKPEGLFQKVKLSLVDFLNR